MQYALRMPTKPIVLCFSGHDPTGGAGIIADHEAISAAGCHALTIITALTIQNTKNVQKIIPVPVEVLQDQINYLLQDTSIAAIKVGLLGDVSTARWLAKFVAEHPSLPCVIDPILWASGGTCLASSELISIYWQLLLPITTVLTPNMQEFHAIAKQKQCSSPSDLLTTGCKAVLITGADADPTQSEIIHTLYLKNKTFISYTCPRLPNRYHGSGCTLAASIAAFLALGDSIEIAVQKAQTYTYQTLQQAFSIGQGQWIPNRILND